MCEMVNLPRCFTTSALHHPNVIDIPSLSDLRSKVKFTFLASISTSQYGSTMYPARFRWSLDHFFCLVCGPLEKRMNGEWYGMYIFHFEGMVQNGNVTIFMPPPGKLTFLQKPIKTRMIIWCFRELLDWVVIIIDSYKLDLVTPIWHYFSQ